MMTAQQRCLGPGDQVILTYRISDPSGVVLEESQDLLEPYTIGTGKLPELVESKLLESSPGTHLCVHISAEDEAFGAHDPMQIQRLAQAELQQTSGVNFDCLQAGALIEFSLPGGELVAGYVMEINSDEVVLDFNHPLIGRDCVFEIEIVDVLDCSKEAKSPLGDNP